jgi:hypothetical protein
MMVLKIHVWPLFGFKYLDFSEHLKTPPCLRDQFAVIGREVDEVAPRVQVREEGVEVGAIACVRGALVGHLRCEKSI